MTDEEVMQKNLTLSFEFSLYVTEHPSLQARFPRRAASCSCRATTLNLPEPIRRLRRERNNSTISPIAQWCLSRSNVFCPLVPESNIRALRLLPKSSRLLDRRRRFVALARPSTLMAMSDICGKG